MEIFLDSFLSKGDVHKSAGLFFAAAEKGLKYSPAEQKLVRREENYRAQKDADASTARGPLQSQTPAHLRSRDSLDSFERYAVSELFSKSSL